MNRLYALNITPFLQGRWRTLLPQLPQERRLRAQRCRDERSGAQIACAGWLLRRALELSGVPAAEQVFDRTALGKPFLKHRKDLHFSVSHSGTWALCAVSDHPVGVDVERPRCTMEIARRFFAAQEVTALEQMDPSEQTDRLCRLWTAKEAFVKAMGGGLTMGLDSFSVELTDREALLMQNLSTLPYRLHEYRLGLSRVCLCAVGEKPELEHFILQENP